MNTQESNKLIAEFMGMTYGDSNDNSVMIQMTPQGNEVVPIESMKYHCSWDWLMPVVQKIGDDYYDTPFDETLSKLTEGYENIWTLQDFHSAVVEFIKENNKPKNN